ncbi:VOC family protein [Caproiciproducens faecalis]|uniref:VOC family protein n=1 Tax=Caproiciproducens faecalis TaxID=2820301 RepID=A0ABS7DL08_9FIRM|nr:VOC family protein [Caproiciproducens faecalis]MBW7571978.1 VOC family protein [Caproiciproducens faecalis]
MLGHYLLFNRNCGEAIKAYEKAFDAKVIEIRKYGDMPSNTNFSIPDEDKELVLHARLDICGTELMCADSSEQSQSGTNMYVSITTKDAGFVQRAWDLLKQDGIVYMELAPSFFAALHGSLQDRFGINWMFTALKE